MSDGDEDFLARWSRRKRAARSIEAQAPDEGARAAGATEAEADADPQRTVAAPAAIEPPEPLPSLEELTAEGDLAAFLREGVPTALRNAAMRKMWALDPAIRDYVGPAEYAWDFNQPGSMAGFGALEPSRSVADFLSTVSSIVPADPAGAAKASEPPEPPPQLAAPVQPPDMPPEPGQSADEAPITVESSEADSPGPGPRRRHGGALPR